MYKKLSVLIPVYNEKHTIEKCLNSVLDANIGDLELEIIISDNNSDDGTKEILSKVSNKNVKILYRNENKGKGANIKNALFVGSTAELQNMLKKDDEVIESKTITPEEKDISDK